MCSEAHHLYQIEVINQHKRFECFAEDYLNANLYHDADDAFSKNQHNLNYGIMKRLLLTRKDLVKQFFTLKELDYSTIEKMIMEFNTAHVIALNHKSENNIDEKQLSPNIFPIIAKNKFEHCLDEYIIDLIVQCANEVCLFREAVSHIDIQSLFACTPVRKLRARSNRLIALFFDGLYSRSLITSNWQTVISNHCLIYRSTGSQSLTAHDLSSALFQARERKATSVENSLLQWLDRFPNVD